LSKYHYQQFNSANLKFANNYRSIANCYNFKTDGSVPLKIPNLFIALYNDDQKELACLIDATGKKLIDSISLNLAFFNNTAIVLKKDKYGIVNTKGELMVPYFFKKCNFESPFNPFDEIILKQNNYDFFYQTISTHDFFSPKYGLIDCTGNLLVDTIYNERSKILCNPTDISKTGLLYENIVFKNDTNICIINFETGKIISKKWRKENYILTIPLVYNKKQYYIYSSNLSNNFGLIDEDANIVLENEFENILLSYFAEIAFSNSEKVKDFCEAMYQDLAAINNNKIEKSFENIEGKNLKTPIINLPQYIFIKKNNKIGVFNMRTLRIEVPCVYESIYKNNKGQSIGYMKTGKEDLLNLK
jgi:hypothetical protein